MLLLYCFIFLCVSINGITNPFNDILSFFMWAAILVPVLAVIVFFFADNNGRKN